MDSKNIVPSDHRLKSNIQRVNNLTNQTNTQEVVKNAQEHVKLKLAKVLKFYPRHR